MDVGKPLLRCSVVVAVAAAAAAQPDAAFRWLPPSQGAVEMFRQMPRAFAIGGGGAGGDSAPAAGGAVAGPAEEVAVELVVHLAPIAAWDSAEGPTAHDLEEGTVRFYRSGAWRPARVARAGEAVGLPAGEWWLTAEAPGFASTASNRIPVSPRRERGSIGFVAAVAPACRVELAPEAAWEGIERVDVVSLTEGSVDPVAPGERRVLWVPLGDFLAYTVGAAGPEAVSEVLSCRAGETVTLPPPRPPRGGRGALFLSVDLPPSSATPDSGLVAALEPAEEGAAGASVASDAATRQERRVTFFFLDLPARRTFVPKIEHPDLGVVRAPPVTVGALRHVQVAIPK
jgi:hypothetical protein